MNHINAPSMGQPSTVIQDETRAPQNGTGATLYPSQYPSGGNMPIPAPASAAAPDWVRQAADRNPHLTPEVAQEQAKAETAKALVEVQREATEQEKLRLEQEKEKTKREEVKQGKQAQPRPADPNDIILEFAMAGDTADVKLDFLVEPFLPRASVVGFYGRGGTSKSSLLATLAADISHFASTLWISCEETKSWIKARHVEGLVRDDGYKLSVGRDNTLAVFDTVATKHDAQGRAIASSFNIFEHLEPAIAKAVCEFENRRSPTLRFVVLDTAVALTTWGKGEGPNDDASVKRLMAYLKYVAEKHDVTIAVIGHSNKGKHEHFADTVAGAPAWVNSPRLSFLQAKHANADGCGIIRVAKSNVIPELAALYRAHMVKEMHRFQSGHKAGMLKVQVGELVWGSVAAEELWDEVTRKATDEDDSPATHEGRITTVQQVVQKLMELVAASEPDVLITRDDVQAAMGKPILRKHWTKVDETLLQFPNQYPVVIQKDATQNNRCFYRKRT